MSSRDGRVLIQIWLPKALAKRLDHERIDGDFKNRQVLIESILAAWLDARLSTQRPQA